MPGMKGIEFLSHAQTIQPHALRILLTGQAPHDLVTNAIQTGIVHSHITKPWDSVMFIEIISKHAKSLQSFQTLGYFKFK
jgi:response regulator RpfG family c-di-GMP phosphodiesterase